MLLDLPGERIEVRALDFVELERSAERVEHVAVDLRHLALLLGVVDDD